MQGRIDNLGDEPTLLIRTTWLDAYKIFAGSIRAGISPFLPTFAMPTMSGAE
jgi:hypothetical protein